jgi:HEAT repeat protein
LRRAALPAAEPAFRALLDDPHFDLRWKSMQGLARLGTPDVDRRLEALARDPHPEVAEAARRASAGRRPG